MDVFYVYRNPLTDFLNKNAIITCGLVYRPSEYNNFKITGLIERFMLKEGGKSVKDEYAPIKEVINRDYIAQDLVDCNEKLLRFNLEDSVATMWILNFQKEIATISGGSPYRQNKYKITIVDGYI